MNDGNSNHPYRYPTRADYGIPTPPPAPKPPKPPMSRSAKIGWAIFAGLVILLAGMGIGAAGSSNNATTAASSASQPTTTVTVPAEPGAEVTVTAPPVTVTEPAPPAKTVTAPPPPPAAVITEDGIYLVGSDIKPGTYKSGPGESCYWARLKNTDGDLDSIIANHNGGNAVVTIKKTDKAFETSGCGAWRKVK